MTLAQSLLFQRRQWSTPQGAAGLATMGLPLGHWTASAGSEGDASGGDMTFQHIFSNPANNLGDSNLYSIEQFSHGCSLNTPTAAVLRIRGMDSGVGTVAVPDDPIDRAYALDFDSVNVSAAFRATSRPNGYKIWVGRYQGIPTDFGDMLYSIQNIGVGETMTLTFYGYFWSPDAVNAPGGIRKPPGDIYSGNV